ncbi:MULTISPECIES: MFS transporter [Micromonospora]|uniref:MFS transporter n=1 Tax=Micromonospora chalcea TaxID=1874 RepID=A0ABX9Y8U2_MICCH|nr:MULTISPECIES: MFS transporter [Micromonospora]MBC8990521.1 MFS transporter [Micromonospora chalcea]MBQ1066752.1 MFS transporter [Micromonospora sp. D75]ODB79002.1 MFS transporter [Micromonospora sp. II]RQW96556.1 MFS transporter [Micromonospora chalcea]RQX59601.1 MFS transporter [Micromonospora chalcea]
MNPRRELYTLVGADLLSNLGTRISVVAIPWLVLETTGSPTKMGLVAAAETLPYMLSSALATPWADRFGVRRTSVFVDAASAVAMAVVALAPWLGFGTLLVLVAVAGGLRGIGDRVKHVLFKPAAERAGVPLIRLTSAYDGLARGMTLFGAVLGGLLIDWVGLTRAIWIDAATFAVCALLIGVLVRPPAPTQPAPREPYLRALRGGFAYLRTDRTLMIMLIVVSVSNMFANASVAVWIPLWVNQVLGDPAGFGLLLGVFSGGALLGNVLFTMFGTRLPAGTTFALGLTLSGAPRLLALALSDDLVVVLVVTFLSGIGIAAVNPLLGASLYQRVPGELQTRVLGISGSVAFLGLPVGALLGGWSVALLDLTPALLVMSVVCLVLTVGPLLLTRGSHRPAPEPATPTPV